MWRHLFVVPVTFRDCVHSFRNHNKVSNLVLKLNPPEIQFPSQWKYEFSWRLEPSQKGSWSLKLLHPRQKKIIGGQLDLEKTQVGQTEPSAFPNGSNRFNCVFGIVFFTQDRFPLMSQSVEVLGRLILLSSRFRSGTAHCWQCKTSLVRYTTSRMISSTVGHMQA